MTDTPSPTPLEPVIVTIQKPGYQTSEFWLKIVALVLTALYASGIIPTMGPVATVAAIAATILGALGYTVARTMLKAGAGAAALMLFVLGIALAQPACSASARQREANAAGAFIDCQTPNLVPLLPDAVTLAKAAVMRWISGSGRADAAGLKSDASKLGGDLGKCAFDAAIAALATPQPTGTPGAPASSPMVVDGADLRAKWAGVRGELGWAPTRRSP